MIKIPSFRDTLNEANGGKASDELDVARAKRERDAQLEYTKRLQEIGSPLATAATKAMGLENPNKSKEAIVFEEPTAELIDEQHAAEVVDIHSDQFHIPADVEPKVSKAEDNEKLAA